MNLPSDSSLSREQSEIVRARPKGTTLVIGPPGSGKTIVAVLRKQFLENLRRPVSVVAWNNVLRVFSGLSDTFLTWLKNWWFSTTGTNFPLAPPGRPFDVDYGSALSLVQNKYKEFLLNKGNWGHLILDEAQDYNCYAHRLLATVQANSEQNTSEPSSILILADQNQRISTDNTTLDEIMAEHSIDSSEVYNLTQNYRNTREIALVADEFYVGAQSGFPLVPNVSGNKPKLLTSCDLDEVVSRIINHVTSYGNDKVGVLVKSDFTREKIVDKLNSSKQQSSNFLVQTYYHEGGRELANTLDFESNGVITVLCYSSSKGLEFDAVFLPNLEELFSDGNEDDRVNKMTLYVMTSRAKMHLTLMFNDPNLQSPTWRIFPDKNKIDQLFERE